MMASALELLFNNTLGYVLPEQSASLLPDKDAREYALERLREYIAALVFRRTNEAGQESIPFQLPEQSIQIQQPDDLKDLPLPGIGIVPGRGYHEGFGLGPPNIIDSTQGVAGPGTALVRNSEYVEQIVIELWGSKKAERRALVAGMKSALRASDGSYGIYLSLPAYYGLTAGFALDESQYIESDETSRNRRRGHLMVTMRVTEVTLVNVRQLFASVETTVLDGSVTLELDC